MFGKQETNPIPVYMINGFLESGKSSFYIYTIGQPYFQTEGKTLLILCEDGEVEYSDKLLKETNTDLERIEDEKDFTPAMLTELANKHKPERILIEWNGMWNFDGAADHLHRCLHVWHVLLQPCHALPSV